MITPIFKQKRLNKRGQSALDTLAKLAVSMAVIGVVLVVGFLIMAEGKSQIVDIESINESNSNTWTSAYNATQTTQEALDDIPGWLPIIIIVVIGGTLIGLVSVFKKGMR